jgi:hypothetical protein
LIGRYRFITFWQRAGQVETRRVTCPVHDVVNNETGSQGSCQVTEGKRNGGRLKEKKQQNVHRPLLVDISHLANKKTKKNRTLPDINRLLQSFFIIFEKIAFTQMPINWPLVKTEEIRVNFQVKFNWFLT